MNRATTQWVDSIFSRTWQLRDELPEASPGQFAAAQTELKQLLAGVAEAEGSAAHPDFLGLAYPLVCWIDEQMTADPRLRGTWSESLLEDQLFGTVDREWMFWKQAELTETLTGGDALDVFFLCVAHGFTGELQDDPGGIGDWMQRTQAQIVREADRYPPFPAALAPPPAVTPLHGRRMMRSMVQVGWVACLVLLPTLSYLGMRSWMR